MELDVIIVGGGITGMSAANELSKHGVNFVLLEASDRVGGRVKTDVIDGFRLDYGFQVLLTGYPEAQRILDYDKLDLKSFLPGALLMYPDGKMDRIGDPLRDFGSLLPTVFSRAGGLTDKLNIWKLRNRLNRKTIDDIFKQEEITTRKALTQDYTFSDKIINQFFEPFYAGIFLEKELSTSRRMFDFVFKMFSSGDTAIPAKGMEEIPKQMASNLPSKSILTNARVDKIEGQSVYLEDGSSFSAPNIIVATEATGLVNELATVKTKHQSTTHIHFVSQKAPIEKGIIALNTLPNRLVNNICCINQVASSYAPEGNNLISLSIIGTPNLNDNDLVKAVRVELKNWFGNEIDTWKHLHTRHIDYALPNQRSVTNSVHIDNYKIREGLYACGDFQLNGSINAAMKVGYSAALEMT